MKYKIDKGPYEYDVDGNIMRIYNSNAKELLNLQLTFGVPATLFSACVYFYHKGCRDAAADVREIVGNLDSKAIENYHKAG